MNVVKIKNKKRTEYNYICKLVGDRNHGIDNFKKTILQQKMKKH